MKPGDLIRILPTNAGWGGRIGVIIDYPVPTPEVLERLGEVHDTFASVLLEDGVMLEWISADWLEAVNETG